MRFRLGSNLGGSSRSASLRPQYWEIYKFKEVVGISTLFMLVDMLGGVFSDLSLAFKDNFDVVAGVSYSLVVVCPRPSIMELRFPECGN